MEKTNNNKVLAHKTSNMLTSEEMIIQETKNWSPIVEKVARPLKMALL